MNLGVAQFYGARYGIAYECFEQALERIAGDTRHDLSRALRLDQSRPITAQDQGDPART